MENWNWNKVKNVRSENYDISCEYKWMAIYRK